MEASYQRLGVDDAHQIALLRQQMLEELSGAVIIPERLVQIQESITYNLKHGHCLVMGAFDKGRMIATAMLCFYHGLPDEDFESGLGGVLCNVYTLPGYRGKGIMTKLLEVMKQQAKADGVHEIILTAEEEAIPLYEKLGFSKLSRAMAMYLE